MRNYINKYLELIQDLRVKAGLTRAGVRDLKSMLLKYITASVLVVTVLIIVLNYMLGFTVATYVTLTALAIPSAALTSMMLPYLSYSYIVRVRRKKVEEELAYFIISEAAIYTYSTELVNDLCELSGWEHVFKELVVEGLRLRVFRSFLTVTEAINTYIKYSASKYVNRLLSDYVLALSKGVVNAWLLNTSNELLHKLRGDAKTSIQLRTTISLIAGVLLSYLPSLMVSLSIISGAIEAVPSIFFLATIIPILIFMPGKTLHLKTLVNNNSIIFKLKNIVIYMVTLFIIPLSLSMLDQPVIKHALLTSSVLLIINGILNLRDFIEVITEVSELPKVISLYAETPYILVNPLKGFKEVLMTCRSRSLRRLGSKLNLNNLKDNLPAIRSWLGRYTYYIIVRSLVNGNLSKEQLLNLRTLTLDMIEDFKHYIVSLLPLMMMSLIMPWLLTSMATLANVKLMNYMVLIYVIVTWYSLYVDYTLYDSLGNTLITGIAMLILALMLG